MVAIYMLNNTLSRLYTNESTTNNGHSNTSTTRRFDQTTANHVNNMTTSADSSGSPALPSGRNNPFSE
jgi:hypothetical protein